MRLGPVVIGAIAVFLFVLITLIRQGQRQARERKTQRSDLGLQRVAVPDPVLTAALLAACAGRDANLDLTLAGLERVTIDQPGTWYVAMVKAVPQPGRPAEPMRVLLVIDGVAAPAGAAASATPTAIGGTSGIWTRRWASGLLLVEGAPDAGDAVRDFDAMKEAGVRAVAETAASSR